MRLLALDSETVALLRAHKKYCREEIAKVGVELTDDMAPAVNRYSHSRLAALIRN